MDDKFSEAEGTVKVQKEYIEEQNETVEECRMLIEERQDRHNDWNAAIHQRQS